MAARVVDDLDALDLGQLWTRVPNGFMWLLRSTEKGDPEGLFFAHVWDDATAIGLGGYALSFKTYADSPEEALRQSLRAMRQNA